MADSRDVARLVARFGKAFTSFLRAEMGAAGTTPARARLLMVLQCRGVCKMSELSAELGVTPRNVTKLVDGLEAEGLVTREPHPYDRRATLLRLTEGGISVCKESVLADRAAVELFDELSPTDREHLARVLRLLLGALGARGHGSGPGQAGL